MSRGFLLLAAFRSGSTWLVDILNHIEGVDAFGELFAVPQTRAGTEALTKAESLKTTRYLEQTIRAYPLYYDEVPGRKIRPFSTFSYLDRFYAQRGKTGFKLMYTQLAHHPEIWAFVRLKGVKVLHLVRSNHLDVIISREMRKATKTTHRVIEAEEIRPTQVTLETGSLVKRMKSLQRNIDLARQLIRISGVGALEIRYEDLVHNADCFAPIWPFLQINATNSPPQSKLVKLVRASYAQSIANYDEVRSTLQGTEFARLLEQGPASRAENGNEHDSKAP